MDVYTILDSRYCAPMTTALRPQELSSCRVSGGEKGEGGPTVETLRRSQDPPLPLSESQLCSRVEGIQI